jgi:hypothetical protein
MPEISKNSRGPTEQILFIFEQISGWLSVRWAMV